MENKPAAMRDVETSHVERPIQLDTEETLGPLPEGPEIKAINRKIDLRICLALGVVYTISILDRVNLPVREFHFSQDL